MIYKNYSVLMSVYDKEKPDFLKLSIQSMLEQTLKPEEIVIVKDGVLTKELDRVITTYCNLYPNVFTVVSLQENVGLGLALNEGLRKCRNELVARMDSDDISIAERCELQIEEFNKDRNLSICGTMTNEFQDSNYNIITSRVVPTDNESILKFSRRRSPFNHPTVMYKKNEVLNCGGYKDIKRKEDIELFARMLNKGYKGINIDKPLLLFRSNEDNYKRRKSWQNCKSYISVIYDFWKDGYSSFGDLIIVTIGQLVMLLSPVWMLKIISDNFLRKSI